MRAPRVGNVFGVAVQGFSISTMVVATDSLCVVIVSFAHFTPVTGARGP